MFSRLNDRERGVDPDPDTPGFQRRAQTSRGHAVEAPGPISDRPCWEAPTTPNTIDLEALVRAVHRVVRGEIREPDSVRRVDERVVKHRGLPQLENRPPRHGFRRPAPQSFHDIARGPKVRLMEDNPIVSRSDRVERRVRGLAETVEPSREVVPRDLRIVPKHRDFWQPRDNPAQSPLGLIRRISDDPQPSSDPQLGQQMFRPTCEVFPHIVPPERQEDDAIARHGINVIRLS